MTEATIRSVAKELAGEFYEFIRGAESRGESHVQIKRGERAFLNIRPDVFGKTFPTAKDYLSGKRHGRIGRTPEGGIYHIDDGSVQQDTPGWLYWYDMARQRLTEMLGHNGVTDHIWFGITEIGRWMRLAISKACQSIGKPRRNGYCGAYAGQCILSGNEQAPY